MQRSLENLHNSISLILMIVLPYIQQQINNTLVTMDLTIL